MMGQSKRGRSWEGGGSSMYMPPPPSKRGRYEEGLSAGGAPSHSRQGFRQATAAYGGDFSGTDDYGYQDNSWGGFGGQGAAPAPRPVGRGGARGRLPQLMALDQGGSDYYQDQSYSQRAESYGEASRGWGQGQTRGRAPPAPARSYQEDTYGDSNFSDDNFDYFHQSSGGFDQETKYNAPSNPKPKFVDPFANNSGFREQDGPMLPQRGRGRGGVPRGRGPGRGFQSFGGGRGGFNQQEGFGGAMNQGRGGGFSRGQGGGRLAQSARGRGGPAPFARGRGGPMRGQGGFGRGGQGPFGRGAGFRGRGGPFMGRGMPRGRGGGGGPPFPVFKPTSNNLPILQRFKNLCQLAKTGPRYANVTTSLEAYLADEMVCMAPAFVYKGERCDTNQPFTFNCKVYINNIFIGSGMASNKKDSKHKACEKSVSVLARTPAATIVNTHEKVDVTALGKQDADIVECAVKTGESNIGNVLSVPAPDAQKTTADFFILEPDQVDESTGMNATCILRQSADFSHLLLKYEFVATAKGFHCSVNIEGQNVANATAGQQNQAKNMASSIALDQLRKNNWTIQIIKRDKPKPPTEQITDTIGRITEGDASTKEAFQASLKAHLEAYFDQLQDFTQWMTLSAELNREERDVVYNVAKDLSLRVETKRVGGGRGHVTENDKVFLVVSKKMSCQDLFDYIWEKGGETWRYKLKAPGGVETAADKKEGE